MTHFKFVKVDILIYNLENFNYFFKDCSSKCNECSPYSGEICKKCSNSS